MGDVGPDSAQQAELMRRFTTFLDAEHTSGKYSTRIRDMVAGDAAGGTGQATVSKRLIVSVDDIRDFDAALADDLLYRPVEHLPVLERAVQDLISGFRQDLADDRRKLADYRVGLTGAFGARAVSPRGLAARLVGGVVSIEGIVTRASTIRPRLVLSVHYCPRTGKFHEKTYRDNASVSSLAAFTQNAGMPGSAYPTRDEEGNPLETEFGKCWYRDAQRITVQEMPERAPPGQLPRSIDVLIEGDLCDACKPGDRVRICGIYRALGGAASGGASGIFKTFVVSNAIETLGGADKHDDVREKDIANVLSLARGGNAFERLARSIAPSIFGHEYVKRALLLLLIGGKEQNLANGTHLRGDINMLMVGDPSTAKSQLLRFVLHTAPLAVSTTGRGSSGVGLTAAVTSDQDTGDRQLEAGAMVLADRGVVCIDEFDKMGDEDRTAIHEVMEQQTVTIAKAGIHASLNARCSVVAAANPVYGTYDKRRKPHENIALPDSLLSRFDLLFIVLDASDKERDRAIADHVLRGHRYRRPTHTLDDGEDVEDKEANADETPMFEDAASALYRRSTASGRRRSSRNANKKDEDRILALDFVKLYVNYAKHRCSPTLTPDAAEHIAACYRDLRQDMDSTKTLPITARCLETLIRLATAHAKCRLDKQQVTKDDAKVAVELLQFALFNQAEPDKSERVFRRRSRKDAGKSGGSDDDSDNDDDAPDAPEGDKEPVVTKMSTPRRSSRKKPAETEEVDNDGENNKPIPESMDAEGPEADEIEEAAPKNPRSSARSRRKKKSILDQPPAEQSTDASQKSAANDDTDVAKFVADAELAGVVERVKGALNALRGREDVVSVDAIVKHLADAEDSLAADRVRAGLDKLQQDEVVVIADDSVFIV